MIGWIEVQAVGKTRKRKAPAGFRYAQFNRCRPTIEACGACVPNAVNIF
jgi:hypothetical protein